MKISYDHEIFTKQKFGGISRYFYELIKHGKSSNLTISDGFIATNNEYVHSGNIGFKFSLFGQSKVRGTTRGLRLINDLYDRINSFQHYDIYHPTYYGFNRSKAERSKKLVVTVYDMIHELYPELFSDSHEITVLKRKAVESADIIIAISESTKKDLVEIFGIDNEKVKVVYLANSLSAVAMEREINLPKRYILFVGTRGAYKDFEVLYKSFMNISLIDDSIKLLCVGGGEFTNVELKRFEEDNMSDKLQQLSCSDIELSHIYSKALCFVFPSRYEGFGLPVLESFSCKCPLICSNSSSLPEVAGEGALFFQTGDDAELTKKILLLLNDENARLDLIARGTDRLRQFSWEKTFRQTEEIYRELL